MGIQLKVIKAFQQIIIHSWDIVQLKYCANLNY